MEFVEYKCLESLLSKGANIATESARPEFPINSEVRKIFNKINVYSKPTELSYYYISEIIIHAKHPEKLTNSDIMKIHKCFYNEEESLDFFAPSEVPEDVAIVKKYKPIPIYAHGNGDHYCVIATGEIKEYIHDSNKIFDASYSQNFKNYTEWFNKWYVKHAPEYEYQTATESFSVPKAYKYCEKMLNKFGLSDSCKIFMNNGNDFYFSIKGYKTDEEKLDKMIKQISHKYNKYFNIEKNIDDDKIYFDFKPINETAIEATIDSSLMMDDEIYNKIYAKVKQAIPNKYKIIYVHIMCKDNGSKHNYSVNIRAKENENSDFVNMIEIGNNSINSAIQLYTEICNIVNPERAKLSNNNKWESMTLKFENGKFHTDFRYPN